MSKITYKKFKKKIRSWRKASKKASKEGIRVHKYLDKHIYELIIPYSTIITLEK